MAEWQKVKLAEYTLEKHKNQFAVDRYNDKKVGWNRRSKLINGKLYVNVKEYRSFFMSNTLTRERVKKLYFKLEKIFGKKQLYSKLYKEVKNKSYQTVYYFFNDFKLKNRRATIEYYLILKKLYKKVSHEKLITRI